MYIASTDHNICMFYTDGASSSKNKSISQVKKKQKTSAQFGKHINVIYFLPFSYVVLQCGQLMAHKNWPKRTR